MRFRKDDTMSTSYKVTVNGYLDSDGEYDVLKQILYKFGVGSYPLLTDRYGSHILSDDINADFGYRTEYLEEENKTNLYLMGYTMNIPVSAELASRMVYRIEEMKLKGEFNTVSEAYLDFISPVGDTKDTQSQLSVVFSFFNLDEDIDNKTIETMVSKDNAKLLVVLYDSDKRCKDDRYE